MSTTTSTTNETVCLTECNLCGEQLTASDVDDTEYLGETSDGRIRYRSHYTCPVCGKCQSESWSEGGF